MMELALAKGEKEVRSLRRTSKRSRRDVEPDLMHLPGIPPTDDDRPSTRNPHPPIKHSVPMLVVGDGEFNVSEAEFALGQALLAEFNQLLPDVDRLTDWITRRQGLILSAISVKGLELVWDRAGTILYCYIRLTCQGPMPKALPIISRPRTLSEERLAEIFLRDIRELLATAVGGLQLISELTPEFHVFAWAMGAHLNPGVVFYKPRPAQSRGTTELTLSLLDWLSKVQATQ